MTLSNPQGERRGAFRCSCDLESPPAPSPTTTRRSRSPTLRSSRAATWCSPSPATTPPRPARPSTTRSRWAAPRLRHHRPLSGTVTFRPADVADRSRSPPVDDLIDEGDETVTVTLSNPQGRGRGGPGAACHDVPPGTITTTTPRISISPTTVSEGGDLVFTVTRALDSEASQTVDYTVTLGSAEAGDISGALTGTVTFAPGDLRRRSPLPPVDDLIDEGDETVTVTLSNPQGERRGGPGAACHDVPPGTINDDDTSISISPTTVVGGRRPGVHRHPLPAPPRTARPSTTRSRWAAPRLRHPGSLYRHRHLRARRARQDDHRRRRSTT